MQGPDPRRRVRRELVAVLLGAEVGAAVGVIGFGSTMLAPLGFAAVGAAVGPVAALGVARARRALVRRWLRDQLRATR